MSVDEPSPQPTIPGTISMETRSEISNTIYKIDQVNPRTENVSSIPDERVVTKGKWKAMDTVGFEFNIPPFPVSAKVASTSRFRYKTPDRQLEPPKTDTPLRDRFGEWAEIRCLYAKPKRQAIIEYTGGEVRSGSVSYFFDHVLPPIKPEFKIDRILDYCLEKKILQQHSHANIFYWNGFSQNPKDAKAHEAVVFNEPFVNIFRAITKAAEETSDIPVFPTTFLHADGNNAMWSERNSDIKPDAQVYLKDSDDTYPEYLEGKHWYNAAFSFHFKKTKIGTYNNAQQVLDSLHHCMSIDPCRRFTLGATIEDTRMRIWTFSRSMFIASTSFDFNNDPISMIKLVLSLAFADKIDLGWDSTLTARYDGSEREFSIEVSKKQFKTTSSNVISDIKADGICTAGTRIYKAFRAEDIEEKDPVIIKDYWPNERYETEDETRQKILTDIKDYGEREAVKGSILTPIASGRVEVRGQEDHTRTTILRGKSPEAKYTIPLPNEEVGNKAGSTMTSEGFKKETDGQLRGMALKVEANRKVEASRKSTYIHRWHYRIVYKEVAIPYHKLRSLKDMGLVLCSTVKTLLYIHKAGWIHRDISPGNLYLFTNPITGEKQGLIGDLEFAKRAGIGASCDVRTGTPDFTAVEVATQTHRFMPETRVGLRMQLKDVVQANKNRGVWANYIHDLESIWWIAVWTFLAFQGASEANSETGSNEEVIKHQTYYLSTLFRGTMDNDDRPSFFTIDDSFVEVMGGMDSVPDSLATLGTAIIQIRYMLIECYKAEARKGNNPVKITNGRLHHEMLQSLNNIMQQEDIHIARVVVDSSVLSKPPTTFKRSTYATRTDEHTVKKTRNKGSSKIEEVKLPDSRLQCIPDNSKDIEYAPVPVSISNTKSAAQDSGPCEEEIAAVSESQSGVKQDGADNEVFAPSQAANGNTTNNMMKEKKQSRVKAIPAKPRLGRKLKNLNGESSPKPKTRSRTKRPAVTDKELVHSLNRRITRSMTRNAAVDKDAEPSASKRTPEARVTRSKSKLAAKKPRK